MQLCAWACFLRSKFTRREFIRWRLVSVYHSGERVLADPWIYQGYHDFARRGGPSLLYLDWHRTKYRGNLRLRPLFSQRFRFFASQIDTSLFIHTGRIISHSPTISIKLNFNLIMKRLRPDRGVYVKVHLLPSSSPSPSIIPWTYASPTNSYCPIGIFLG